ncbi:ATP-binding cassette domain-containing protein [Algiphilus sp. W345]|uniref:ATP-binding cassette domain-containing protein n=1 Tax=Banduia mediterranea TaxID=3075609 RepID=A0ABU2WLQ7_9GAMM|nr:ATP-binding cassette domain-containing protein [Algiphilus sp. W345]MDT0498144.1 ATP-binding cassette domain-containing protein [Algiphilus sp. W345]
MRFSLQQVGRRYGGIAAVDGLSLDIESGTTTALIGSSGSGKSTVLRLLLGLERPDSGRVSVDGQALDDCDLDAIRHRIGYVIQDGGLFPHLSVLDNLALLPRHLGWTAARIRTRAEDLLARVQLADDLLHRRPQTLSGGQRQRVALMRALMLDPPALLLDEPLGALDPIVRHELQADLGDMFATLGKTVLLVTHDLAEAAFLAPRLMLMAEGRVVQDGSLDDLRARPASDFVRRFVAARRPLPEAP